MNRRRQHRIVFAVAGIYNLTWGAWVALSPQSLYHLMGIPLPTHPEVAACLGMVIGLYGIIYLEIARSPEHGWIAAAVGLTGKLLGPAALAVHIITGEWDSNGDSGVRWRLNGKHRRSAALGRTGTRA